MWVDFLEVGLIRKFVGGILCTKTVGSCARDVCGRGTRFAFFGGRVL